jgi:hypothetical protein
VSSTLPDVTRSHHPPAHHRQPPAEGLPIGAPGGDAEVKAAIGPAEYAGRAAGGGAIVAQLRMMLEAGGLDLPRPGGGRTARR